MSGIGAVESDDCIVLVLDPDAPDETPLPGLLFGRYVKNKGAHFSEEFAADIIEIVALRIQTVVVQINHLQKTERQEFRSEIEKPGHAGNHMMKGCVAGCGERLEIKTLGKFRAPDEVV